MNACAAYDALSSLYDRWIPAQTYAGMLSVLVRQLESYPRARCLDLCCGTATLPLMLAERGFLVTGMDASAAMLDIAKEKIAASPFADAIRIVQGDITVDPWPAGPFDAITCTLDSLNYLPFERLPRIFQKAGEALDDHGVLMFDFNSEYKLKNIFGNSNYGESFADYAYVWVNTLFNSHIVFDISMFTPDKEGGRLYSRRDEKHVQYVFPLADIENALRAAGFGRIGLTDDYSDKAVTAETLRIAVVAER